MGKLWRPEEVPQPQNLVVVYTEGVKEKSGDMEYWKRRGPEVWRGAHVDLERSFKHSG